MLKRVLGCLSIAVLLAQPAMAQTWPAKPISWVVPFSAGGPTDQVTRQVANQLSAALGQPVVVENVVGAGGAIGLDRVAKASPDGYTIVTSANTLKAIAPHMSKLPYDTVKSFTPVGGLAAFPYTLVVSSNSPISSLDDLISRAKAAPGKVTAGAPGVGTGVHLASVLLAQRIGSELNIVQYKGGSQILADVIAGHVDMVFEVIGTATPMVKAGRVKALATTATTRHPLLPDTQTVAETVPGFEMLGWFAVFGPANMPAEIVRRLNDELNKIHASEQYRSFLETRGYGTMAASPSELAGRVDSELKKWGPVVKSLPPSN